MSRIALGEHDEARELARAVLAEHPGDGAAELALGLGFHREKRYGLARPHLERATRLAPSEMQTPAWYFLGWCRYWLGELEPAREAFETHLERDPTEGDSHFGLGVIELELGRGKEAEPHFRKAIELLNMQVEAGKRALVRDVAKCHARLADVYLQEERLTEAKAELLVCVELWPPHHAAWYKLYRVHVALGEKAEAAAALAQYEQWKARAAGAGKGG